MTGLGKPVSILDASEKEPGIELKSAGEAAIQSGMTEVQQGKAEKGKNLQNHRVLQTKLTAKMPDGTALLLDVLCDTGAETDVVDLETARRTRNPKRKWLQNTRDFGNNLILKLTAISTRCLQSKAAMKSKSNWLNCAWSTRNYLEKFLMEAVNYHRWISS